MVQLTRKHVLGFSAYMILAFSVIFYLSLSTTIAFYFAGQAEDTISSKITEISYIEAEGIFPYTVYKFEVRTEVWNSYPARQKIEAPTSCGMEFFIDFSSLDKNINSEPSIFELSKLCKHVITPIIYDSGLTVEQKFIGIRFDFYNNSILPAGVYKVSYGINPLLSSKISSLHSTTFEVNSTGQITSVTPPEIPNWGQTSSQEVSFSGFMTAIIIIALHKGYSRKRIESRTP